MECLESEHLVSALDCSYSYVQKQVQSESSSYLTAENYLSHQITPVYRNQDNNIKNLTDKSQLRPTRALSSVDKVRWKNIGSVPPTIQENNVWLELDRDKEPKRNLYIESIFKSSSD